MAEGVDGLLQDKSRSPGKTPLPRAVVERAVDLTLAEPPGEATHWTGPAMAAAAGISLRSVQRIWPLHQRQPNRIRTFKRSRDPEFAAKLEDIVAVARAADTLTVARSNTGGPAKRGGRRRRPPYRKAGGAELLAPGAPVTMPA